MKALSTLVLLSAAVQLCSTLPGLEPLTCSEDSGALAAQLALDHINKHHDHGYKFRLNEVQDNKVKKVADGCNIELKLHLLETVCHNVNPTHFRDCELRRKEDGVMANCTVVMTARSGKAEVTNYKCKTQPVLTTMELKTICPYCPILIPLNSSDGLRFVHDAVRKFNQNSTNLHIFTLQEVGRIRSGSLAMTGRYYYPEFVLVETNCPVEARILPEACKPICPHRAHHAFCRSSFTQRDGLRSLQCDIYPPTDTTPLGAGEQEPVCGPPHHVGRPGPPPHAAGQGPPPRAAGQGPPPSAAGQGPPPSAAGQGPPPTAAGQGPPPRAAGQGPPPSAAGQGPPPRAAGQGPPPSAAGQGPPPRAAGQGPPPRAAGQGPPPSAAGQGPPPRAAGQGPPPHAAGQGPPPHAAGQGPPPHAAGQGPPLFQPFHQCTRLLTNVNPALHPICPWPEPPTQN